MSDTTPATNELLAETPIDETKTEDGGLIAPETWNLTEDIKGEGEIPTWFKKDKYANVTEQAKAYADLEKIKPLENAPEKYELTGLPNDTAIDKESPFFQEWMELEKSSKTSQEQFNKRVEFIDNYLKSMRPNKEEEMQKLGGGEIAENKILAFKNSIKNILSTEEAEILFSAVGTADLLNIHTKLLAHFKETPVAPTGQSLSHSNITVEEFMENTDSVRYNSDSIYRRQRDKELAAIPLVNGK